MLKARWKGNAPAPAAAPVAGSALSPEEATLLAALQARAENPEAPGGRLSPDEMNVLVQLTMKQSGMTLPPM